ncbi:MAG: Invasion associated protein p60 [uncultured Sulfurovum sp.]|uniref:Invasion associated protein p60 n=1 Tax=uncultured Sulfurovum sp. TaxID=269237 RepID=A0A6S6T822_9BACT|nr:MAG: Invasion associated protein p60 [uncultured Sulfurovum sp.]
MNLIRNILLAILFLQFLVFMYVKLVYEKNLVSENNSTNHTSLEALIEDSIVEIIHGEKELPISSEYTLWDKEMIAKLNEEIKSFNNEMQKIVDANIPIETKSKLETKPVTPKVLISQKVEQDSQKKDSQKKLEKKNEVKKLVDVKVKPLIPKVSIRQKVEKYAKEKLGQKYVWGATGPNNFDCSGFTRDVFLCTTGIKIPRVSRDQSKVGTRVEYKELKRGDMVFFDTEKKYTGKVNHVGIYLKNGNFIHASSAKKKVIITNFKKKPFYKKRFLWGRRIVKSKS